MVRTFEDVCFGELRSTVHRPPDAESWASLVSIMERWSARAPETFRDHALPYAVEHASRWPDRMRVLPPGWLAALRQRDTYEPWWGEVARAVHLHDLPSRELVKGVIRSVAHSPLMHTMTVLELPGGYMRNLAVWMLARSPYLSNLRELDLSYNGLSSWGISALLRAPSIQQLRRLVLCGNGLGEREVAALATHLDWNRLTALALSHNRLDAPALATLLAGAAHGQLARLDLERNRCGDEGARALGQSRLVGHLQHVNLARNQIGREGASALAGMCAQLRTLDLSGNPLGDEGLRAMHAAGEHAQMRQLHLGDVGLVMRAQGPVLCGEWPVLEVLDLSGNQLGAAGSYGLSRQAFPRLRVCDLSGTSLDERAALHLMSWRHGLERLFLSFNPLGERGAVRCLHAAGLMGARELRLDHCHVDGLRGAADAPLEALTRLCLRSNTLGDEGIAQLVRCGWLRHVRHLDLRRCEISDEGARLLADCEHLSALEVLDVGENQIGKRGALALMDGQLGSLHSLHLNQCPLGDGAVRALAAATPHHALKMLDLSWARELTTQGVATLRSARRFSSCQIIAHHASQPPHAVSS